MRRIAIAVALLASGPALGCPACASTGRGGPTWLHAILVLLPFVVAGAAARAIYAALRDR